MTGPKLRIDTTALFDSFDHKVGSRTIEETGITVSIVKIVMIVADDRTDVTTGPFDTTSRFVKTLTIHPRPFNSIKADNHYNPLVVVASLSLNI
jgi:hypothetical protein